MSYREIFGLYGRMENQMEATIMGLYRIYGDMGYYITPRMENQMQKMENEMETVVIR